MANDERAAPDTTYDVFISYNRDDKRLARVVQAALERYHVPASVPRPSRRIVVFRDETDFSGTSYFPSIDAHLRASRKMLLICSPAARRSKYVTDEIRRFIATHSADDIVPVLAAGQPNNEARSEELKAFPDVLGSMPLAANLTAFEPRRHRLQDPEWSEAWHLILANLLNAPRDAFDSDVDASQELARAEAIRLWESADARRRDGNQVEALLHAAAAHAILPHSEFKGSLGIATAALFPRLVTDRVLPIEAPAAGLRMSPDGSQVLWWTASGRAQLIDTVSGMVLASANHSRAILNAIFLRDGSAVTYVGEQMNIMRAGRDPLAWEAPFFIVRVLEAPVGELLVVAGSDGEVCLWSRHAAGPIALKTIRGGDIASTMFSADGHTLLAMAGATLLQMEHTGAASWFDLGKKLRVHQAVTRLGVFLVSDGDSIRLVAWLPESNDIAIPLVAKRTSEVLAAQLSPNVKRVCWIDRNYVLHSREWFMYRDEGGSGEDVDDGRVSVQLESDEYELAFWNGDAVAVAYGRRRACALAADGTFLWRHEFDRRAAIDGCRLHHELGLLTHVDEKLSRVTYLDLADGSVIESRRAVRPAGYVHSGGDQIAAASGESALRLTSRGPRRADQAMRRYYDVAHVHETDGRVLLSFAGEDRSLRILDAVSGEPAFPVIAGPVGFANVFVTPDHRTALTIDQNDRLTLWRAHGPDARETPLPLDVPAGRTSISEAGDLVVVSAGPDILMMAVDDTSATVIHRLAHGGNKPIVHLQLGPGGDRLASASEIAVRLWDARTGQPVGEAATFAAWIMGVAFAPGGRTLFAWSADNSFVMIDTTTGQAIRRVHPGPETFLEAGIRSVTASHDGSLLFTAGPDRCMRIWHMATGDEMAGAAPHPFPLAGIAPSDKVERILTWGADVVSAWNPWTSSKIGPDIEVPGLARAAFWTLDNARAAVMEDASVSIFDPETALLVAGPWHHGGRKINAHFVDSTLVTWTGDGLSSVWELEHAKGVADWRPACERVTGVAFDINRRVLTPLNAADHALLDTPATRSALDLVYGRSGASRAAATCRFPSGRPLTKDAVRGFLVAERLFDAIVNPVGRPTPAEPFVEGSSPAAARAGVMIQRAEDLMWQVGGSERVDVDGAVAYVRSMNAIRFAGFDDWRIPRVYEAAATLSPALTGRLHVVPGLGEEEDIWTSDRLDDTLRWIVRFGAGHVGLAPADSAQCVRLVRSHTHAA